MADVITFRPDDDARRALAVLTRDGTSVSSAVRAALIDAATRPASFRPEIEIDGQMTRVLAEQTAAVDPGRLGASSGTLSFEELRRVEAALRLVLEL